MGKIQTVPLNEICETIQYGYTASAAKEPVGPKFVRITDIVPDAIDWAEVPYCQIEESKKEKYVLKSGDIVIARTGATTGYAKYLKNPPPSIFASYLVRVRVKEGVDPRYVGFVVQSDTYKRFIKTHMGGAAQPNANAKVLTSFSVPLPSFQSQKKIASILSAYDDLIENNLRRIKILEEMAHSLYREWFVKFRFPGHQKVKMVNSPLGKIPEGWEVKRLGDVCTVIPGYAFKSGDWQKSGVPVIKIKNINSDNTINTDETDCVSEDLLKPTMEKFLLKEGDILIAMTGATAGKIGKLRSRQGMLLNQRVAKIEPHNPYNAFVWCTICTEECQARFFRLADGAAQPNMSGHQIEGFPILLPMKASCQDFSEMVNPFLLEIDNLIHRNRNLRQTRDLLLPKLISGELDVSELDISIPEANT